MTLFRSPTLELSEVNKALEFHQFTKTIRLGSQQTWEGFSSGERRVVVVDEADSPYNYGNRVLEGVIRNSGIDKRLFYRAAGKPLPYAAFLRRQS